MNTFGLVCELHKNIVVNILFILFFKFSHNGQLYITAFESILCLSVLSFIESEIVSKIIILNSYR